MQNIRIIDATMQFLTKNAEICTHALTLQTNLPTYNVSNIKMQQLKQLVSRNVRYFIRRLACKAYGNGAIRNKKHILHPTFITTIEGTLDNYSKNKTLHIHMALGNILTNQSKIKTEEQLEKIIKECWLATEVGVADIDIKSLHSDRWINYITKELYDGNFECVDWTNTHIANSTTTLT
jgi:hypothetical protein